MRFKFTRGLAKKSRLEANSSSPSSPSSPTVCKMRCAPLDVSGAEHQPLTFIGAFLDKKERFLCHENLIYRAVAKLPGSCVR